MRSEQVLVVSNCGASRAILSNIVSTLGYQLAAVSPTGRQAIEDAVYMEPQVAIVERDLIGPVGAEQVVRAFTDGLKIPVIILEPAPSSNLQPQSRIFEHLHRISRPFRTLDIHRALSEVLHRHASHTLKHEKVVELQRIARQTYSGPIRVLAGKAAQSG